MKARYGSSGLRILFVIHGFITLAASIVLVVAPSLIPGMVGIHLDPSANVLAYLLAGAEFGLAYAQGANVTIIGNVVARAVIVMLFTWLSRKQAKLD
jgi:hypothetical protein